MKRVYWTTTILLLSILTSCSSTPTGSIETAAVLPPVATAMVLPANPTTPALTPTLAATMPVVPTLTAVQEQTTVATEAPSTPTPTSVPGSAAVSGAVREDLYGKLLFVRGKDVWVYTPRDGAVRLLMRDARDARWSLDGKQIAFVRDDGLYIANGSDARLVHAVKNVLEPVWAPDGTKLVFERGMIADKASAREIWVYELGTGEARKVGDGADPSWSPESKRIAYVTAVVDEGRRRNQLRVVNWRGENAWTVVRDVPNNTPAMGMPGGMVEPSSLDHNMLQPFWGPTGQYVYAASFVLYQALAGFSIWERADVRQGGSTFIGELPEVVAATLAPNRQAVLFSVSSARGDSWFVARGVESDDSAWSWAETSNGAMIEAPAWSPDSYAIAYYRCELEAPDQCDLRVRDRDGEAVVIDDVFGTSQPDRSQPLTLDWTTDE